MGWGKFDDAYPHHPKMLAAGVDGLALDVAAVCYSNRYGTDGFIATETLPGVFPPVRAPKKVAAKLVAVGRWEEVAGGWVIHDFEAYNPTSAEVEERRAKRAAAGRKGGQKSKPRRSKPKANASGGASDTSKANANPGPVPEVPSEPSSGGDAARPESAVSELIAEYVNGCQQRPAGSFLAPLGREIKRHLADGVDRDVIAKALVELRAAGGDATWLRRYVNNALNPPKRANGKITGTQAAAGWDAIADRLEAS